MGVGQDILKAFGDGQAFGRGIAAALACSAHGRARARVDRIISEDQVDRTGQQTMNGKNKVVGEELEVS